MHMYHYPLFESGVKTRCEQLLYVEKIDYYVNTTNKSKIHFSYSDNGCAADYGKSIVGILYIIACGEW